MIPLIAIGTTKAIELFAAGFTLGLTLIANSKEK